MTRGQLVLAVGVFVVLALVFAACQVFMPAHHQERTRVVAVIEGCQYEDSCKPHYHGDGTWRIVKVPRDAR